MNPNLFGSNRFRRGRFPSFLALAATGLVQVGLAGWMIQKEGAEVPALYDVAFPDASHGWAVGAAGAILGTADGGRTWNSRTCGAYAFQAVYFRGVSNGWAAGNLIYATTNGGATWVQQDNPAGQAMQAIRFVSASRGYAAGNLGKVLTTANGGATWVSQASGTSAGLYAVDFVSPTRGWIAGYGTLLHTTDGENWTSLDCGISVGIYGLDFVDATKGWAVGQDQRIWRTADGGTNWTLQYQGTTGYHLLDIEMRSIAEGWACGRNGVVLQTSNGGETWTPAPNPAAPRHMHAVSFPASAEGAGWAVGELNSQLGAVVAYTPPATLAGVVRLEGRSAHGGTEVTAGRGDGLTNTAYTGAAGEFLLDSPTGRVAAAAGRPGYLSAVKPGLMARPARTLRLPDVLLPGGDATADNRIDTNDVAAVMDQLFVAAAEPDLNGDGAVDVLDAVLAARNQGLAGPLDWPTRGVVQWLADAGIATTPTNCPYDSAGRFAPDVVAFPGGLYRMYYTGTDGTNCRILSMTSTNGQAWLLEPGVRIAPAGAYRDVYSPDLARLTNGLWRMYFSARTDAPNADILSATSSNGLDWTSEPGARLAHGDTYDRLLAQSSSLIRAPDATPIVFPDGAMRMIYTGHDGTNLHLLAARSEDGLGWIKDGAFQPEVLPLGQPPEAAPLASFGAATLGAILDPFVQMEEDGTFSLFYSPFFESVADGVTNRLITGLLRLWSADGVHWRAGADGGQSEPWPFLSGLADGNQAPCPWMGMIDGQAMMLGGTGDDGGGTDGVPGIGMAWGLCQDDRAILRDITVRRVSISQQEVVVDVDQEAIPLHLRVGTTWYVGAEAIVDGMRAAHMVSRFIPVTNASGQVVIPLDYIGVKPLVTTHIEVMLWRKVGELEGPSPVLVCWKALQVSDLHSAGFDEMADALMDAGYLFRVQSHLLGGTVVLGGGAAAYGNAAPLSNGDLGVGTMAGTTRIRERILWLPPSSGRIEAIAYAESETRRATPVPGGPYLCVLAEYRYRNQWGDSGRIDALVYDAQTNRINGFTVEGPTVDPTRRLPATVPGGDDDAFEQAWVTLRYTGTETLRDTRVKLLIRAGSTTVAEHWLAIDGDPERPFLKTWRPLARLEFGQVAAISTAADRADVVFDYGMLALRSAPRLPVVTLEALDADGDPLGRDVRATAFRVADQESSRGRILVRYAGTAEHGPSSASLRLQARVDGVLLDETNVLFEMEWGLPSAGFARIEPYPAGIEEALPDGADLRVPVKARAWTSGGGPAQVEVLACVTNLRGVARGGDPLRPIESIVCTPVPVESLDSRDEVLVATNDAVYAVDLRYTGSLTNLCTSWLLARLVDPATGAELDSCAFRYPKYWNPASTGAIHQVTILTETNAWEVEVEVDYSYRSILDESAFLLAELSDSVLHDEGEPVFYVNEPRDYFAGTRVPVGEGFNRTARLTLRHAAGVEHVTDRIKVTLQSGRGSGVRDLDRVTVTEASDRTWPVPPHYELDLGGTTPFSATQMTVNVSYRLKEALTGHDYALRVCALRGGEGTLDVPCVGELAIADPAGAVGGTRTVSVLVGYTGSTYCVRTHLLCASILDNGAEAEYRSGAPVRVYDVRVLDWKTNVLGVISTPVLIPISGNEAALQAEFDIGTTVRSPAVPYVMIHAQDGGYLYPSNGSPFSMEITPPLVPALPPEGTNGVIRARLTFNGATNLWTVETDYILVGLRTTDGVTLLEGRLNEPYAWSVWDDVAADRGAKLPHFSLGDPEITRPSVDRFAARFDYRTDRSYVFHPEEGLVLRGYLWSRLTPLFRYPDTVTQAMEDSGDLAGYEDYREWYFDSTEYVIGRQTVVSTPLNVSGVQEDFTAVDYTGTMIVNNEGTAEIEFRFLPPVGSIDVDMLTLAFFRRDGTPLFSRTVPIPRGQQTVCALDELAPIVNGQQLFTMTESLIPTLGELKIMLVGFNNSRPDAPAIWLRKFPTATLLNPYYPLELIDLRPQGVAATNVPGRILVAADGFLPTGEPYLAATGWVNAVAYRFRLAGAATIGMLQAPLTFVQGDASGAERVTFTRSLGDWVQPAAIDDSGVTVAPGDYCNQHRVSGIGVYIAGYIPRGCQLEAVALADGVPVREVVCEPQVIGTNRIVTTYSLNLDFNYTDSSLTSVSADQIRLVLRSPASGTMTSRLISLPEPIRWYRPQATVEITLIEQQADRIHVHYRIVTTDPQLPDVPPLVGSLDPYLDNLHVKIEALCYGQPPPGCAPIEEISMGLNPSDYPPFASTSAVKYADLRFSDPEALHAHITHIKAELGVYRGLPLERRRGVAYSQVDYETVMTSDRSYIVGTLDSLTIVDDGDGDVRRSGEDLIGTIGLTVDDLTQDLATTFKNSTVKQVFNFPVEYNAESRWLETDAIDTWEIDLPVYCGQEAFMNQSAMGMAVTLLDDDALASSVYVFLDLVFKAAEIVATAFGQSWASEVLDFVNSCIDGLLQAGSVTDQVGTGAALLPPKVGWGLDFTNEWQWSDARYSHDTGYGQSLNSEFRTRRVILRPRASTIRVRLDKIVIHADGDDGEAEIYGKWRVYDGRQTMYNEASVAEGRIPEHGYLEVDDPYTWKIDKVIFESSAMNIGPVLFIEVAVWDQDDPEASNDHDILGDCCWTEWIHAPDWTSKSLEGHSNREGSITVFVTVEEVTP